MSRLSILFLGMEGIFSRAPLAALLHAGHDIRAVVVPRPRALPGRSTGPRLLVPPRQHSLTLQLTGQPTEATIVGMAWDARIPVLEIQRPWGGDTLAALTEYAPDVLCVACFPYLLPPKVLAIPRHGGFNVHPSLLPTYRGPSPLFWVYRDGLEHAGVTVHQMDAGADTGAIAAQQPVEIEDGTPYANAERILSRAGGQLLASILDDVASEQLQLQPQPLASASMAPAPTDADFHVPANWPARRAFNFIHGLADWRRPFTIVTDDGPLVVTDAVGFDPTAASMPPIVRDGERVCVRFSPGVLYIDYSAVEDYPR